MTSTPNISSQLDPLKALHESKLQIRRELTISSFLSLIRALGSKEMIIYLDLSFTSICFKFSKNIFATSHCMSSSYIKNH